MIEVADALRIVLDHARPLPGVETILSHHVLGQALAEDVAADMDSPPFTKALMDGYAIRAADVQAAGVELEVTGEVQAGGVEAGEVRAGTAVAIYTGAPMPAGADAVVMKERCERLPPDRVRVNDPGLKPGKNVMLRGTETKAGDVVLSAGTGLTPVALGQLAAVGRYGATLHPRPLVGVLATGDELVGAGERPEGSQIRNTNGPMLCAQVWRAGGVPEDWWSVPDVEAELVKRVGDALVPSDVLLLVGGVSAGKFDFVPGVLKSLGVETRFHHIRMKPGKPLLFGTLGNKLVFGLPGNPMSAFVAFELFVRPALRKMMGHAEVHNPRLELPLAAALAAHHDRPTFHPAKIVGNVVEPLPWRGSADLRSLLPVNALIELPAGPVNYGAGDVVGVVPIG